MKTLIGETPSSKPNGLGEFENKQTLKGMNQMTQTQFVKWVPKETFTFK